MNPSFNDMTYTPRRSAPCPPDRSQSEPILSHSSYAMPPTPTILAARAQMLPGTSSIISVPCSPSVQSSFSASISSYTTKSFSHGSIPSFAGSLGSCSSRSFVIQPETKLSPTIPQTRIGPISSLPAELAIFDPTPCQTLLSDLETIFGRKITFPILSKALHRFTSRPPHEPKSKQSKSGLRQDRVWTNQSGRDNETQWEQRALQDTPEVEKIWTERGNRRDNFF